MQAGPLKAQPLLYDTVASVRAARVPSVGSGGATHIRTAGYHIVGDGGGALYRRVAEAPGHALWIQSLDGSFWAFADIILTPEMAGAKGDATFVSGKPASWNGTDNTTALQNAIDAHTYFHVADRISFRKANEVYRITKSLHCGYGVGGFTTTRIEGPGTDYRGEGFNGATILCDFSNAPGVVFQGGRANRWKGVGLRGRNWDWGFNHVLGAVAGASIDDTLVANWLDPGLVVEAGGRHTPYAAFAVDPYSGAASSPAYPLVAYPSFVGSQTQYDKAYSSDTLIEDCYIGGFDTGIVVQPSGADGNGDFTKVRTCLIEYCRWAISVGQTQSRGVHVSDTNFSNVFCIFATDIHGKQEGKFGAPITNCSASECLNILSFGSTSIVGPVELINFYSEGGWRIGDVSPTTSDETSIEFRGCQFAFDGQNDVRGVPAKVMGSANQPVTIKFDGGVFSNFPSVVNLDFAPSDLKLDGTLIVPQSTRTLAYQMFAHNATGGGLIFNMLGSLSIRGGQRLKYVPYNLDTLAAAGAVIIGPRQLSNRSRCSCIYIEKLVEMSGADGDGVYNSPLIGLIDKTLITHASVSDKTLTFSMPAGYTAASFQLYGPSNGDVLWDSSTGSVFFVSDVKGLEVTAVLQNNYKAVGGGHYSTLTPIPLTTGYFYVGVSRVYTPDYYLQGDFSTRSLTIANCGRSDGYNAFMTTSLARNDYLYYDPIRTAILAPANGKINAPIVAGSLVVSGYPGLTVTGKRLEIFIRPGPVNA
ncbi:hypothetical protein SAMN05444161_8988 [Rhizobiales bacterium GAS191]|nr:hypothetical protein SAMN05444161_8988 [Rhizobiales bacterium GAS191]